MKVCFINPPYGVFAEELDAPFNLMYLAAVAEKCGWEASIVDMRTMDEPLPEANVYGVTSTSPQWPDTLILSDRLASEFKNSLKIVGGPHVSACPNDVEQSSFEIAITGEGEQALTNLFSSFPPKIPYATLYSVIYGKPIDNLDSVPFPARHLVNWKRYKRGIYWGKEKLADAVSIISSRGCPFNCVFCGSHVVFGHKVRFRSVENVIAEMRQVVDTMGYRGFNFHDDTFCINRGRVFALCTEFLKLKKFNVVWRCLSRVDTIDEELLKVMANTGCKEIILGVESGSNKILKNLNKGTTAEQNLKAMRLVKESDIQLKVGIIVGSPGETWETVEETEELLKTYPPNFWNVSCFTPFPGCYDSETEILTIGGWKRFTELTYDDEIASMNEQEEIIYEKPSQIIDAPYNQMMWRIKSKQVDLLVTPNHNIWCKRPNGMRSKSTQMKCGNKAKKYTYSFQFYKAEEILQHPNIVFQKNAKWTGKETKFFEVPPVSYKNGVWNMGPTKFKMDDFLEFLGYYISEGSTDLYRNQYRISISQSENGQYRTQMENCLVRMGLKICRHDNSITFSNKALSCYLKPLGHSYDKYIPQIFLELSSRQLSILFNALIKGDGTVHKGNSIYFTTSKRLADQIQEILLKINSSGYIRMRKSRKNTKIKGRTINSQCTAYEIAQSNRQNQPRLNRTGKDFYKVPYEGRVYCVTIPHHLVYVRRNGKAVWCGNSYAWEHPEELGIKILTRNLRDYSMVGKNWRGTVVVETEKMSKADIELARDRLIDLLLDISPP